MPEYVFRCPKCHKEYDSDNPNGILLCENDLEFTKRVYTLGGISFKGSGFYKNDSRGTAS